MSTETLQPASAGRGAAGMAAVGALAVIALVAVKGAVLRVQDWGTVYWWLGYGDGMVRRGLVGHLFQAVFGRLSREGLLAPVMTLHVVFIVALALAMSGLFCITFARLAPRHRLAFTALSTPLLVSQLWPTLTFNVGYLDPLLLVLAGGAAMALRRGWKAPVAAVMGVGPFIHEYFVFLVPFILAAGLDDAPHEAGGIVALDEGLPSPAPWSVWALGGLAVLSALAVVAAGGRAAAVAQFAAMPLEPALKTTILETTMTQSVSAALGRMLTYMTGEPGYTLWNVAFFMGPALIAAAGLLFWRAPRGSRTPLLQAAAGLFPASALLIAWDLSRMLVMTTFTAGLLFLLEAERRTRFEHQPAQASGETPSRPARGVALWALLIVAAGAFALYPFVYSYYQDRPFVLYFPPDKLREAIKRSPAAVILETPWGHRSGAFPERDVSCSLQPRGDAACTHPLVTGAAVYGPYITLPLGLYQARFTLHAPPHCANPVHFDAVDMAVRYTPVAQADTTTGGDTVTMMPFRVTADVARRGDFEFRTFQTAGAQCATLVRVQVRQVSR